jgi:hypothetical protein
MKRIGNLYPKVYAMDNLRMAHQNARRGKGWYQEVAMVDADPDHYLGELQQLLIDKTYHTSEYTIFNKCEGRKIRTLYKLPYIPDRVCQWALMLVIGPTLQKTLIDNTFSAIVGRGPHLAWSRVQDAMYHKKETKYCLKFDIKQYYPSIQHDILKSHYRRLFKDPDLLWLIDEIINSTGPGIPIGNYLSQWSGNLYLSPFDHWCKEVQKCHYYFRYMDDIVIFHESKEELHDLEVWGREWLSKNLRLRVKPDRQVFPTRTRGLDFVGYRFFDGRISLRKSTAIRFKRKMRDILSRCRAGMGMTYSEYCSINSYKGWIKWCDNKELIEKYVVPLEPYTEDYYIKEICHDPSPRITGIRTLS